MKFIILISSGFVKGGELEATTPIAAEPRPFSAKLSEAEREEDYPDDPQR